MDSEVLKSNKALMSVTFLNGSEILTVRTSILYKHVSCINKYKHVSGDSNELYIVRCYQLVSLDEEYMEFLCYFYTFFCVYKDILN